MEWVNNELAIRVQQSTYKGKHKTTEPAPYSVLQ